MSAVVKPSDLAGELGVDARLIRQFLRAMFPRPADDRYQRWLLTPEQAAVVRRHFRSRG